MKSVIPLTRNNLLVVVPMFNEQDSIGQVLDNLLKENYQLVVVDDGSKDNSRDIALSASRLEKSPLFISSIRSIIQAKLLVNSSKPITQLASSAPKMIL